MVGQAQRVCGQAPFFSSRGRIPHLDFAPSLRCNILVVRVKRNCRDRLVVTVHCSELLVADIPKLNGIVWPAKREPSTILAKGHRRRAAFGPFQAPQFLTRFRVPNPDRVVLTTRRSQELAIRGETESVDVSLVPVQLAKPDAESTLLDDAHDDFDSTFRFLIARGLHQFPQSGQRWFANLL